MRDATDVSGAHASAVTSLKQQLAAVQEALSRQQEGAGQMQVWAHSTAASMLPNCLSIVC